MIELSLAVEIPCSKTDTQTLILKKERPSDNGIWMTNTTNGKTCHWIQNLCQFNPVHSLNLFLPLNIILSKVNTFSFHIKYITMKKIV
jgi:hypothetical protein